MLLVTNIPLSFSSLFFQNLQELGVDGLSFSLQELCVLANATPRLKTLGLKDVFVENAANTSQAASANFTRLESLAVIHSDDLELILDCFDVPALSCLTVVRMLWAPAVSDSKPSRLLCCSYASFRRP